MSIGECDRLLQTISDTKYFPSLYKVSHLSYRYEILTPNAIPRTFMDGKQASELMVGNLSESMSQTSVGSGD